MGARLLLKLMKRLTTTVPEQTIWPENFTPQCLRSLCCRANLLSSSRKRRKKRRFCSRLWQILRWVCLRQMMRKCCGIGKNATRRVSRWRPRNDSNASCWSNNYRLTASKAALFLDPTLTCLPISKYLDRMVFLRHLNHQSRGLRCGT